MKKKIIAISIIMAMIICNSMTVWAADKWSGNSNSTTYTINADGNTADSGTTVVNGDQGQKDVNATYVVGSGITDEDGDGVPDVDDNGDNNKDTVLDEDNDGTIETPTGATYSVTITWGDMNFKYKAGTTTWDPSLHAYTETTTGTWEPANPDGNKIDVVNNSNVGILAQVSYSPESPTGVYKDVRGGLYDTSIYTANTSKKYSVKLLYGATSPLASNATKENAFVIANSVKSTNVIQKTGYLILKGKPTKSWTDGKKIGSVTIAISYNLESAAVDTSATDTP